MSRPLFRHARRRLGVRHALTVVTTLALTGASLVLTAAPASAAVVTSSDPAALATAMAGPGADVTGAGLVHHAGAPALGIGDSALSGFPTNGPTFTILTSGDAGAADNLNTNLPDTAGTIGDQSADLGGLGVRGDTDHDVSVLEVDLDVPATANCLSFDFAFYTEEYADFVGGAYNDAFIAELDASTWTTSGSAITAPGNFAFDGAGNVVSVNATGLGGGFSLPNAAGTTYDGATQLLSAATPVTAGAHSLYLSIFDQGDNILDSAAFVDNLRVGFVPDPVTQCVPGAQVKQFQLDLTPATATLDVGFSHTVTASLQDLNATPPELAGGSVVFETTGANTASGTAVTDAAGEATFTYTGSADGTDTISACYDIGDDGSCDTGDPFASAQAVWVNTPPTNDAGGPYAGDEGSAVTLAGAAADVNGDALTHAWTYAPVSGVDVGATCAIAAPGSLATSVTCTDDGVYELTLTTSDGVNTAVVDTAELTIANVAPVITGVTTAVDPVAVGTPTSLSAGYTDDGSNDTHSAVVDWGDGSTTPAPATGGTVTGSHSYTAAGIYTVCVTVTDDDGAFDEQCSASYVVVYDPGAGFVTGGGWVDVAPGSFPEDPSSTGPGRFGFVSKYHKGASTPSGNTEFQFHAGGLELHSTSYDWLVVAGHKAIYKGSGRVNGVPGYTFQVSAVDGRELGGGAPDTFRMKIWQAGTVVFDNQLGDPDDATASNALTRGSIVIHK